MTDVMASGGAQAGVTVGGAPSAAASPGAQGIGASMSVPAAALWIIGSSMIALIAIGVVFRRPISLG